MWRYALIAVSFIGLAAYGPAILQDIAERNRAQGEARPEPSVQRPQIARAENREPANRPANGRSVRIAAGRGGHFRVEARLNGAPVDVMVDTGATMVAMNESTARRLGIRLGPADFKYAVNTANGVARVASATLDAIEIGPVRVRNVEATIARDEALSTTLLGMSFLGKLRRYEVDRGTLVLTQ